MTYDDHGRWFVIEIYCDESSHNGKVTKLHQIRVAAKGYVRDATPGKRRSKSAVAADWAELGVDDPASLVPDLKGLLSPSDRERRGRSASELVDLAGDKRHRYQIECPVCGLRVVGRDDRVSEVMCKLRDAGVDRLSLRGLGAILR